MKVQKRYFHLKNKHAGQHTVGSLLISLNIHTKRARLKYFGKFNLLSSIYKGFEKNSFVHNKVIIFIAKRNYHVDFFKLTMNSFSCR